MEVSRSSAFWSIGLSGLIGAAIGAGSVFFTQKQATTTENHYYMELDKLRHATFVQENLSFEERLAALQNLNQARRQGYRAVFDDNLSRDISEITAAISRIEEARRASEEAAAEVRRVEEARAAEEAQARREQAVRTNPLILMDCGPGTQFYCP
jgi:hypothetical protein